MTPLSPSRRRADERMAARNLLRHGAGRPAQLLPGQTLADIYPDLQAAEREAEAG